MNKRYAPTPAITAITLNVLLFKRFNPRPTDDSEAKCWDAILTGIINRHIVPCSNGGVQLTQLGALQVGTEGNA